MPHGPIATVALAALSVALAPAIAVPAARGEVIGSDDFDGGGAFVSRIIIPDTSGNVPPGTFPGSLFDVFGIIDRTVNVDFEDDTVALAGDGSQGMFPSTKTDAFFGFEDVLNPDNPSGTGTVIWLFDVTGYEALSLSVDLAAYGDFEPEDVLTFTASIDGGPPVFVLILTVDDLGSQTYFFEDGSSITLSDPLTVGETALSNVLTTFAAPIAGTGRSLSIRFHAAQNGSNELFAMDDLVIEGTPSASCAADLTGPGEAPDGNVDALDFLLLIAQWGTPCVGTCEADITGPGDAPDGNVDSLDFLLLIAQWGSPANCPAP